MCASELVVCVSLSHACFWHSEESKTRLCVSRLSCQEGRQALAPSSACPEATKNTQEHPRMPKLAQARPRAPSQGASCPLAPEGGPQTLVRAVMGPPADVNRRPRRLLGCCFSAGLRCLSPDFPSRRRGWPSWRPAPSSKHTTEFAPAAGAALYFLVASWPDERSLGFCPRRADGSAGHRPPCRSHLDRMEANDLGSYRLVGQLVGWLITGDLELSMVATKRSSVLFN